MSRTSCIQHPAREPRIIIHRWQLEFCTMDGKVNECAAALLSFFEYWHNIKLDMLDRNRSLNDAAERERKGRPYPESLLQWHSTAEMEAGLLIFKRSSIQSAIDFLVKKNVVDVHRNPVLKYDNTRHFLFHPEVLSDWLLDHVPNSADAPAENSRGFAENGKRSAENSGTIPETSSENTTKTRTRKGESLDTDKGNTSSSFLSGLAAAEESEDRQAFDNCLVGFFGLSDEQTQVTQGNSMGYLRQWAEKTLEQRRRSPAAYFISCVSKGHQISEPNKVGKAAAKPKRRETVSAKPEARAARETVIAGLEAWKAEQLSAGV